MTIQVMESTIEELRHHSPVVPMAESIIKYSFKDNGSIRINSKTGEVEKQ